MMGKFRVVEYNEDSFKTKSVSEVYERYHEASRKWDELMNERPKAEYGIQAEIDGDWYALA